MFRLPCIEWSTQGWAFKCGVHNFKMSKMSNIFRFAGQLSNKNSKQKCKIQTSGRNSLASEFTAPYCSIQTRSMRSKIDWHRLFEIVQLKFYFLSLKRTNLLSFCLCVCNSLMRVSGCVRVCYLSFAYDASTVLASWQRDSLLCAKMRQRVNKSSPMLSTNKFC